MLVSIFLQYNYNRDQRMEPGLHRRSPTELELSSELEAARPQTAGNFKKKVSISDSFVAKCSFKFLKCQFTTDNVIL